MTELIAPQIIPVDDLWYEEGNQLTEQDYIVISTTLRTDKARVEELYWQDDKGIMMGGGSQMREYRKRVYWFLFVPVYTVKGVPVPR